MHKHNILRIIRRKGSGFLWNRQIFFAQDLRM